MIYMIDSIRRQQIDKVLQYDRNMNLQAINLEKNSVAKMGESTDLSATQNQEVIQGANALVNSFMMLQDKKRAEVTSLQHYTAAHAEQHTRSVDELSRVYDVIDAYNKVVSLYLGNNSVQTKQIVGASIRKLLAYVAPIARGLLHMITTYAANVGVKLCLLGITPDRR